MSDPTEEPLVIEATSRAAIVAPCSPPVARRIDSAERRKEEDRIEREPMVATHVVRGLIEAAHRIAGIPRDELWRVAEFPREVWEQSDGRLPRSVAFRVCDRALELSGDPALGLRWSERVSEGSFLPVSSIIPQAETLRHAFEAAARFNRLLSDEASYHLTEEGATASLRRVECAAAPEGVQRFSAEMMVAGIFRIIRHFGVDGRAVRVMFKHKAPSYAAEYERVFGQAPLFGARFTGVVFDRALLDRAAPQRDREVHDALSELAERRLWRITEKTPYALRVREVLLSKGPLQKNQTMDEIARVLGLGARTLRRRLADEGTSYNVVLRDALATIAQSLLRNRRRTIEDIAEEMGFSDGSTFHRAFKSWTGVTPGRYRGER